MALKPDYVEAYYNRGLVYRMKEDYKHAVEDYTKAIEIDPYNADAYYRRSRAWLYLGEEEKAKSDMKTASDIGINNTTAIDEILRDYDRAWKTLGNL
ncbi:tetratricopeptide repeat protein [Candidatus Poribacteria bacterium]|nr:tetratricopeptide repeat protein [Candidatus Poribacteria bacterium]MYG07884.1 tetratricopeptide repeat protein [Candidatus Poribacteria bacterium]MYK21265.1 tetratricopeptide repeat protein [Candidatus Poribacteria bacterium]